MMRQRHGADEAATEQRDNSSPNTKIPAVTASSILRRPYFSASGPETRVKMPKNTTPAISIHRKSLRVIAQARNEGRRGCLAHRLAGLLRSRLGGVQAGRTVP